MLTPGSRTLRQPFDFDLDWQGAPMDFELAQVSGDINWKPHRWLFVRCYRQRLSHIQYSEFADVDSETEPGLQGRFRKRLLLRQDARLIPDFSKE